MRTLNRVIVMSNLEASLLLDRLRDGRLPCAFAFDLAAEADVSLAAVGVEANRLGVRISRCQLGLFGYPSFQRKGFVERIEHIPGDLSAALRAAATERGVSCADVWRIADEHGLPRMVVAHAAEGIELPVSPCQLGCF